MTSKSSIAKDFLTEMQMPSLEDPVKSAANIARMLRKSSELETDISMKVLKDPWSSSEIQKAQLVTPQFVIAPCQSGPLPVTTKGNRYVIVLIDYFTKWPEAIPFTDLEVSSVAEELVRTWISRYLLPMIFHSDQGTNFISTLFTELCILLGILKTRTTALRLESDGMVERFNRTILNHLSLFVSRNQTDWDTHLPLFLLAYRSADHEVTGFTPAEMIFG
ncbi:Retrovirus-related Pol polyprotein from transposon 412 [Araneus ventricosus]|uniref:Retrovirus-related Pol polyprotein from transposon 412 n=1 Tax=Araneus ventricosus TaxID=182803 RepID=A0A4Y2TT96_ARAVE|nr:Retrovirus-related Pol polyprotein from transposon 412 [Araneus ventricosus]